MKSNQLALLAENKLKKAGISLMLLDIRDLPESTLEVLQQ